MNNKNKNLKIAILTHYYKSINFGGVLQSFSLVSFLNQAGYNAIQISYKGIFKTIKIEISSRLKSFLFSFILFKRFFKFYFFRKNILHTETIYSNSTLYTINKQFDCFIVGSDQVWNSHWFDSSYFLTFVESNKIKISYAASIGSKVLKPEHLKVLSENLKTFKYISLRENDLIPTLDKLVNKEIVHTCDPTLLLEYELWDRLAGKNKNNRRYLLSYFLDTNSVDFNKLKKIAILNNLELINIPLSSLKFNLNEILYTDKNLFGAGPIDFISLIKNSQIVITDSFHAVVFSIIFGTDFFVLKRQNYPDMLNRIENLLKIAGIENKIIELSQIENKLISIIKHNPYYSSKNLLDFIDKSRRFLINSLKN
jgi:hypothetical protein